MSAYNISRRTFLKNTAGTGAVLALTPAKKFADKLIPYIHPPPETRPGVWSLFSTVCRECPAGCGMQIRHMDGRAIKAEGHPDHPVNRGALCARGQSSVQGLYDPDRLSQVSDRARGAESRRVDWAGALSRIGAQLRDSGGRVAILSDLQTGALAETMIQFVRAFGSERLLSYEPFNYEALKAGHEKAVGLPLIPAYRLEGCDVILSLSADFLETWISPVEYTRAFAGSRSPADRGRLIYAGPRLSMTAANADDFIQVPPGAERWLALGMLKAMAERNWHSADAAAWLPALAGAVDMRAVETATGVPASRIEALARVFAEAKGSVALAGPTGATGEAAVETAASAMLLNLAAGRIGQTVDFSRPHALSRCASKDETIRFLSDLTDKDVLIVHGTNPAYSLPGGLDLVRRAGTVVYLGTMMDETAELATWCLPVDSPLESWGDYEPCDGTCGLMQPVMARLYDTRHAGDVLLEIARRAGRPLMREGTATPPARFEEWLRARWTERARKAAPGQSFDECWTESLRQGGSWEPRADIAPVKPAPPANPQPFVPKAAALPMPKDSAALWAWPSVMLADGRSANRGWLQEAPDPTSTIVWDAWVDLHPDTARQIGLAPGDVAELENESGRIQASVRLTDDVGVHVAAVSFGQGHTALGRNARGRGANAFALLGKPAAGSVFGVVRIRKINRQAELVSPCATQDQHHRDIVQWTDLAAAGDARQGGAERVSLPLPEGYDPKRDLYSPHAYPKHRWAMSIDLDRCTGCGACAVACYAENNLPVVGREQVNKGREMAWMRVIPYRADDSRRLGFIPLLCQQCDAAPCEPVCPVFASVHNDEGLNAQVYNRCIGTRYCSHNCPYKVRRFNWMDAEWAPPLDRQLNPDVTARSRGVMEKCTFCIQRIREIEHNAQRENRAIRDGEIKPACVQTCPANALVFGDLLDPQARISALTRRDPRRYHVLEELNTKPAVVYLRRVKMDEIA